MTLAWGARWTGSSNYSSFAPSATGDSVTGRVTGPARTHAPLHSDVTPTTATGAALAFLAASPPSDYVAHDTNHTVTSSINHSLSALTPDNSSVSDGGGQNFFYFDKLEKSLWIYFSPCLFVLGIIGNALILAVMRRRRMRGTTTAVYLPLIAVTDILVIIFGIVPEWLEAKDVVKFKEVHPATCKLEKFLFYTTSDTSIWILVLFTFDRFVAVVLPLRKKSVCQPRRAHIAAAVVLCAAVTKNFHVFWTRGAEYTQGPNGTLTLKRNCGRPTPEYQFFEFYVRPWIAFSAVNAVPFTLLLIFNVAIIRYLARAMRTRKQNREGQNAADKGFIQTVAMCLSASFTFLICMTPSMVLLIGRPYWSRDNPSYDIAKAVNNQLAYINHSANILLYCATGKRFRQELWLMLKCYDDKYATRLQYKQKDGSAAPGYRSKTSLYGRGDGSAGTGRRQFSPDTNGSVYTFAGSSVQTFETTT